MPKKEKTIAVNIQEDEDGYILYPGYAIIYKNAETKQYTNTGDHVVRTGAGPSNPQFQSFIQSPSGKLEGS